MPTADEQLAANLSHNWWILLLRGIAAILFGVLAWLLPVVSLAALVLLFGAYALADGLLGIWSAIQGRKSIEDWWLLLLWGLAGVGIGVLTFLAPGITALVLLFYIAAWAIVTGAFEIVTAIRLRKEIEGEWLLILAGTASVAVGALLMIMPGPGALALLWVIAAYAIVFGCILVVLSIRIRKFGTVET